jgi:hypothetical protein
MKPDLKVVPGEEKEKNMQMRIEEIRQRANPNGNLLEHWDALKCQYDRTYLLACIDELLTKGS